jgi:mono/diheme cytochrome c family protein
MKSPFILCAAAALLLTACDRMPGKPTLAQKWRSPDSLTGFNELYNQNCLGCHGDGQTIAGSLTLKDPLYVSLVPKETLRSVITQGVSGHNMPAFGKQNGGSLSEEQINTIVDGILAWSDKSKLPQAPVPPYAAPLGNVASGKSVFAASCATCHGQDGNGGPKAGSVVDKYYLDLVSDQYLRTIAIVGRPELGCPDFAHRNPSHPMTATEISDVVAWLTSHRVNEFDRPVSNMKAK